MLEKPMNIRDHSSVHLTITLLNLRVWTLTEIEYEAVQSSTITCSFMQLYFTVQMDLSLNQVVFSLILLSMGLSGPLEVSAKCEMQISFPGKPPIILDHEGMQVRWHVSSYMFTAIGIEIRNCNFQEHPDVLFLLSTYSVLTQLTVLNSTMTKADFRVLQFEPLKNMRFYGNNISSFNLELVANLVDLDLSFNGLTTFRLGVGSHLFLKTINLSNNNLVELKIVSTLRDLQTLDLSNNKLVTLDFAAAVTASVNNLHLDMTNNDLLCSPNLTMEWMILKSKNTFLATDATCHFPDSANSYLISEYGLHFTKESDIFEILWSKVLLQAHLQFDSVRVSIDTYVDTVVIKWRALKPMNSSSYLIYRSPEGNEIQTDAINLNNGERLLIDMKNPVEVCFSTLLRKPTEDGHVDVSVPMACSTLSKHIVINNFYQYAFLGVSGFAVLYLLVSICFCFCLCRCLRNKKSFKTDLVALEELQSSSFCQSRETVVTNNVYIESETVDKGFSCKDDKKKVVDYDPYLPMESVDRDKQENDDNVYDGMVYDLIKDSLPSGCDVIKDTENIYDKC